MQFSLPLRLSAEIAFVSFFSCVRRYLHSAVLSGHSAARVVKHDHYSAIQLIMGHISPRQYNIKPPAELSITVAASCLAHKENTHRQSTDPSRSERLRSFFLPHFLSCILIAFKSTFGSEKYVCRNDGSLTFRIFRFYLQNELGFFRLLLNSSYFPSE